MNEQMQGLPQGQMQSTQPGSKNLRDRCVSLVSRLTGVTNNLHSILSHVHGVTPPPAPSSVPSNQLQPSLSLATSIATAHEWLCDIEKLIEEIKGDL